MKIFMQPEMDVQKIFTEEIADSFEAGNGESNAPTTPGLD